MSRRRLCAAFEPQTLTLPFPPPPSTRHRESHAQSRDFIVRLANALMLFGAPTHRIEGQLESAARVLELDAHFFYLRECLGLPPSPARRRRA